MKCKQLCYILHSDMCCFECIKKENCKSVCMTYSRHQSQNDCSYMLVARPSTERPEVQWWATQMEKVLKEHDPQWPEGWSGQSTMWLFTKLWEEFGEIGQYAPRISLLDDCITPETAEKILGECIDLSNVAMMLGDRMRKIIEQKK